MERAIEYLGESVASQTPVAQERAAVNALGFIERFATRFEAAAKRLLPNRSPVSTVQDGFADPDAGALMRHAIISAARTSSEERHEILARAVANRLTADAESRQAVASSMAVEAVPRLAGIHLDLLGVAAFVYYIAPVLKVPDLKPFYPAASQTKEERALAWKKAHALVEEYSQWVRSSIEALGLRSPVSQADYLHLVSAGCLIYDHAVERSLGSVLTPPELDLNSPDSIFASNAFGPILAPLAHSEDLKGFHGVWVNGLQHATLTAAGLLIGTSVYDWKSSEASEIDWNSPFPVRLKVDDPVWNGQNVSYKFGQAIERFLAGHRRFLRDLTRD